MGKKIKKIQQVKKTRKENGGVGKKNASKRSLTLGEEMNFSGLADYSKSLGLGRER